HDVVAQAPPFAEGVLGDDARPEKLAGENELGVPLLVLEPDEVYLGAARRGEIDAAVPDVRKLMAVALLVLGQVEVEAAHGELGPRSRRNGVAVDAVFGGPIRPARDLVVDLQAAALVVVPSA